MKERTIRLGPREQQIAELLLQGCDNSEIAGQLQMARRTVKAHFNRLFMRFGITGGIKRVKLATMLYRRQICSEESVLAVEHPAQLSSGSSNSSHKGSRTEKSRSKLEPQNTSLRITCESSMTSSGFGTESNSHSGTKRADTKLLSMPDVLETWEHSVLNLDRQEPGTQDSLEQ
jgi:regulatory LuxR family protein